MMIKAKNEMERVKIKGDHLKEGTSTENLMEGRERDRLGRRKRWNTGVAELQN